MNFDDVNLPRIGILIRAHIPDDCGVLLIIAKSDRSGSAMLTDLESDDAKELLLENLAKADQPCQVVKKEAVITGKN